LGKGFICYFRSGDNREELTEVNEIIEIAAQVLDPFGIQIEDADFSQLVRPKKGIPASITQLTTIDNDMVSSAEEFASVGNAFIRLLYAAGG
jgi:DNA polymerase III epsilon subunit-like protein